jgi:DnaJ like chaperone protein
VQTAYRSLIRQYHPDKVANLGEELRELAEVKSKAINKAYNDALAAVGSRQ